MATGWKVEDASPDTESMVGVMDSCDIFSDGFYLHSEMTVTSSAETETRGDSKLSGTIKALLALNLKAGYFLSHIKTPLSEY